MLLLDMVRYGKFSKDSAPLKENHPMFSRILLRERISGMYLLPIEFLLPQIDHRNQIAKALTVSIDHHHHQDIAKIRLPGR